MTRWLSPVVLGLLVLLAVPFALRAFEFGLDGLEGDRSFHRLFHQGAQLSNLGIFAHMMTGAILTLAAPLQVIPQVRRAWPRVHHLSGYAILLAALVTGISGLTYILLQGTIGGPLMSFGFGLYGMLMLLCAAQTLRHARARRFALHRAWALRLFVLAIGSWLYRVHYTLWYIATEGAGMQPDFSGWFDQIQIFAFFLPYLVLVEVWLRHRPLGSLRR